MGFGGLNMNIEHTQAQQTNFFIKEQTVANGCEFYIFIVKTR